MKISEIKTVLPYLFKTKVVPVIYGKHGVGKTQSVIQFALENGYTPYVVSLGQMTDQGDIFGLPSIIPGNESVKYFSPDFFPKTPRSILILDEWNRAPREMAPAIMQLVLEGKMSNGYQLPEESFIVCMANPNTEDYVVNDVEDEAYRDRFCFLKATPTLDEYLQFAKSQGMDQTLLSFLKTDPLLVPDTNFEFTFKIKPSNRTYLDGISRLIKSGLPESLWFEVFSGMIGDGIAMQFLSYREDLLKLDLNKIAKDYPKYREKVLELTTPENYRPDILRSIIESIGKSKVKYNETESENVKNFILDLPVDIAYQVLKNGLNSPEFRNTFLQKDLSALLGKISKTEE